MYMTKSKAILSIILIVTLWLTALYFLAMGALAGTDNNPFYKDKMVPGTKVPCCTKKDCRVLENYRYTDGAYEIWFKGHWFRPNKDIVSVMQTPDGNAHACYTEKPSMMGGPVRIVVFCVWIPLMGV